MLLLVAALAAAQPCAELSPKAGQGRVVAWGPFSVQAGSTAAFSLALHNGMFLDERPGSCARWSVSPATAATISPDGVLSVPAATRTGTVLTVTATTKAEGELKRKVAVYSLRENPLVGRWRQTAWLNCAGGAKMHADRVIEELVFRADGEAVVTRSPFETYVDFRGTYKQGGGRVSFEMPAGNRGAFSGKAEFSISGSTLTLRGVDFGLHEPNEKPRGACGYVFFLDRRD